MVDALADLHSVDIRASGLDTFWRGPGYVTRQVSGWSQRYRAARTDDVPDGEDVMSWLADNQPADVADRLIHGDWRFDNLVLDPDNLSIVRAVLDWEMATVGDPLMDLGAALAYWVQADDDPDLPDVPTATVEPAGHAHTRRDRRALPRADRAARSPRSAGSSTRCSGCSGWP